MRRLGSAAIALLLLGAPARPAPFLVDREEAPPVPAWSAFCREEPAECIVDRAEPQIVVATPELFELVQAVNRHVNRTILAVRDIDSRGALDRWEFPVDTMGDCEDMQLLKRRHLVEAGIPRRALPMTVVFDEAGEGHAVLTVRTDLADLILDNKVDEVRRWDETNYVFVKRESETRTGWAFVEPKAEAAVLAAAR